MTDYPSGADDPSGLMELRTVRDFLALTIDAVIASLPVPDGGRVLDAGTGGGGALPPLAHAVGTAGQVLAVDSDPEVCALATDYVAGLGIGDRVTVQRADITVVLSDAATTPDRGFDVIWAADVIYPAYFEKPADVVRLMAQALRPGGVIALFYPNYYNSTFLPWHDRLKHGLIAASTMNWDVPDDGPHHRERYLAWLLAADLDDVRLKMFPRVCFPVDADPTVRQYLELALWPYLRNNAVTYGGAVGFSAEDVDLILRLLTPGSPDYVLDQPGYFVALPTLLATGSRRP